MRFLSFIALRVSTTLLLVITFLPAAASGEQRIVQINIKDLSNRGARLVPSTDPTFSAEVRAVLGDFTDPVIEADKPFSVVLRNESNLPIVAYALRWLWVDESGKTTFHDVFFHTISSRDSQMYVIPPGKSAFVTLSCALTHAPEEIHEPLEVAKHRTDQMWSKAAISVVLDGVIFGNGEFVGPDDSHGFAKALGITQALPQFLADLQHKFDEGASESTILAMLEQTATIDAGKYQSVATIDWENHFVRVAAERVLDVYKRKGPGEAQRYLSHRSNATVVKVWR